MSNLFQKAELGHSHLKCGILGLAGAGKTMTSSLIAIGLTNYIKERGIATKNVTAFVDTERGADWLTGRFHEHGIELQVARTRALADLPGAIKWATDNADVMIIDSITHFWRIFCEEYAEKKGRKRGLEFSDWDAVKKEWRKYFTDLYLNSPMHIIMCGRQGYEYDMQVNDAGKKELVKTAVKMKAEGETGFEPSLLIQMEQDQKMSKDGSIIGIDNIATVLKDRGDVMNGAVIKNPTFESFLPHVKLLTLGLGAPGIDTTRTNNSMFTEDGDEKWAHERRQREIWCEEIEGLLVKHFPSQSQQDKAAKIGMVEKVFQTRSWTRVQTMKSEQIKDGFEQMKAMLEPVSPANGGMDADEALDKAMVQ